MESFAYIKKLAGKDEWACNECGRTFLLPWNLRGLKGKCPYCKNMAVLDPYGNCRVVIA